MKKLFPAVEKIDNRRAAVGFTGTKKGMTRLGYQMRSGTKILTILDHS